MNIVVVVSDTFRYDYVGANGNSWIRTPDLDRFAQRAVGFDQSYVASFPTIPMRTDWFTGRFSFPHHGWQPLNPGVPVLAETLRKAGYLTQLIVDNPHMLRGPNHFDRGFDGSCWLRGQEGDTYLTRRNLLQPAQPLETTRQRPMRWGHPLVDVHRTTNHAWQWEEDRFCVRTLRTASQWLEENSGAEPFFLWVDCFDVHEPWDPPQYLVNHYDPAYTGPQMLHPNYGPADRYTPEQLANLRAHYAGECDLLAKWFGYLVRKIEDLDLLERTAIVFTSDHGMFLGEHNRTGKSNIDAGDDRLWPLYAEVAHTPLFIALPGLAGGQRRQALVQAPDLFPTLAELAGVPDIPGRQGHSLLPVLRDPAAPWPRTVAVSCGHNQFPRVTDGQWSYYPVGERPGVAELYDLGVDPGEQRNVAATRRDIAEGLHSQLRRWLGEVGAAPELLERIGQGVRHPGGPAGPDYHEGR